MRPIRDVLRIVDELSARNVDGRPVSCTKGCAGCCHQVVLVTMSEAVALLEAHPEIAARRAELEAETDYLLHPETNLDTAYGRPCVLLRDKLCTVYADRPIACRAYFVSSDPALCHGKVGDRVQTYDTADIQALAMRELWERNDAPRLMAPLPMALLGAIALRKGVAAWRAFLKRVGVERLPPGEVVALKIPDGPSVAEWRAGQSRVEVLGKVGT
jgi:Fe-S-cluster containining protein